MVGGRQRPNAIGRASGLPREEEEGQGGKRQETVASDALELEGELQLDRMITESKVAIGEVTRYHRGKNFTDARRKGDSEVAGEMTAYINSGESEQIGRRAQRDIGGSIQGREKTKQC
jgi:hypothetical protein